MTTTFVPPTSAEFAAGALDALVNHALLSIMYDSENRKNGTHYNAADNLECGADEALHKALAELAPDVAQDVTSAFELGLQIAQIVVAAPLADNRDAIRTLLEKAIERERRARAPMVAK